MYLNKNIKQVNNINGHNKLKYERGSLSTPAKRGGGCLPGGYLPGGAIYRLPI